MKENGVKPGEIVIEESAICGLIRYYTREAGVRNLEREVGTAGSQRDQDDRHEGSRIPSANDYGTKLG